MRGFYIYIYQGYWPAVFFPCDVFAWLRPQGTAGFIKWVWKCLSYSSFWNSLRKIDIDSFLSVWRNSQVSYLILDFSFGGDFWLKIQSPIYCKDSISYILHISLSDFTLLQDLVMTGLVFPGIHPFLQDYQSVSVQSFAASLTVLFPRLSIVLNFYFWFYLSLLHFFIVS